MDTIMTTVEGEEDLFSIDSSEGFSSPITQQQTYRVTMRIMNFTNRWIQPIHEGIISHLQRSPVIVWKGRCTVRPWSNIQLLNVAGYSGKPLFPGQFGSDEDGNVKCASLLRSPDPAQVMVLIVDVERWGERREARVCISRSRGWE